MSTKEYVSTKEQAAWIRAALKAAFPGRKFSVRKSSGSAVCIDWTDGPTVEQVQAVSRKFELEGFDGMTDMRYDIPLTIDGREVFGGGLILEQRSISNEWRAEILAEFERITARSIPDPDVRGSGYYEIRLPLSVDRNDGALYHMVESETEYVSDLVHRYAAQRSR